MMSLHIRVTSLWRYFLFAIDVDVLLVPLSGWQVPLSTGLGFVPFYDVRSQYFRGLFTASAVMYGYAVKMHRGEFRFLVTFFVGSLNLEYLVKTLCCCLLPNTFIGMVSLVFSVSSPRSFLSLGSIW